MSAKKIIRSLFTVIFSASLWQVGNTLAAPAERDLPPTPSIDRDVNLIYNKTYSRPQIPPLRTTSDGRVALQTKTRTDKANDDVFQFYLMAPEKLKASFQSSPKGAEILSSNLPISLPRSKFVNSNARGESVHSAICETNSLPKLCGASGNNDCYEFKVITPFYNADMKRMEIWSTPVEVEVSEPKSEYASIKRISTQASTRGVSWKGVKSMLETIMTADGKLMVGRIAQSEITWPDSSIGRQRTSQPNVIYSFIPQNQDACDVSELRGPYPITHAHHHDKIRDNYGFAAYPMRDGIGNKIANGADFGGSYAWIDSLGNNLFFGTFNQSIMNGNAPSFNLRCVGGGSCPNPTENMTKDTIGISVNGLWTKGRTILLDNALNNVDWNLQARDSGHTEAKLYRGNEGWIHVGSGRDNAGDTASHMPAGGVGNINFIDSIENKLNAFSAFTPSVPRDVAWWVSTGKSTDLVSFDDWLNPMVFIDSDMTQSIEGEALEPNANHIQNAATGRVFNPPSFGEIIGNSRIEPVALGGVQGKGFFSRGRSGIRYTIPSNRNGKLDQQNWYLGLFIDPRIGTNTDKRKLIEFPDGSLISLAGLNKVTYSESGAGEQTITLSESLSNQTYSHLGFRIYNEGAIELFLNGILINTWDRPNRWKSLFKISNGQLWLGRGQNRNNGFSGWLDQFKVIAEADKMNAETFCNHASGSLVSVGNRANAYFKTKSSELSNTALQLINQNLATPYQSNRYWCFTENRSVDGWVDLKALPNGLSSLREHILFPEGPLVSNQPRPDSSQNEFCLSCHQSDNTNFLPNTLKANALQSINIDAESDPRRQPSQPPAKIYGNVPAHIFGQDKPPMDEYSNYGIFIDRFLFDED